MPIAVDIDVMLARRKMSVVPGRITPRLACLAARDAR